MRVAMYRPFADPWRQSMRVYAERLHEHLRAIAPGDEFELIALAGARLAPPMRYWDQYVRYQRVAKHTRADVHHVLDHGFAHLAGALPPGRIAVSFHDAVPIRSGLASFGTRRTLEIGMRSSVARAARFLPISEASARDAVELFGVPPAQINVIHLGVDDRFRPAVDRAALRARLGITTPVVLIVGHTQPYMNVEGAVRAAGIARTKTVFDIVKIGAPLTVEQGRLAESCGLAGGIRELGIVSDAQIVDWYAAADALLYLPRLSGFGLPAVEAMASGTPVVASNTGGVGEIAAHAAATVDPGDHEAAASALVRVLTDEAHRAELIRHGLARALEYSWRRTAESTLRVYRELAAA